ncbi:MAG: hypothetical protein NZ561_01650 [Phycisphaerae bacterium]|nr:hypothetical protein [Phycisphaerae bacterium]MDW8261379.1 hypothetical protein [Phycisphaerales bacterium]
MRLWHVLSGLIVSAGFALSAAADYDVSPKIIAGQIRTNAFFDIEEFEVENVRVFPYSFGEDPTLPPNELADPGFHPLPPTLTPGGSGFAPGSQISVNAKSVLQVWNGAGSPAFTPAAAGTQLTYAFGTSSATVSGSAIPANSVLLGPVDMNGEFDDHLDTEITVSAAAGIYLFAAAVGTTMPGIVPSADVYFLFNYGLNEEKLEEATLFVRDTFAPGTVIPVVPEPTGLLVAAAGIWLGRRRPACLNRMTAHQTGWIGRLLQPHGKHFKRTSPPPGPRREPDWRSSRRICTDAEGS